VKRLRVGWPGSFSGWLGVIRGAGHDVLDRSLPEESLAALARALLLGEATAGGPARPGGDRGDSSSPA
jgi:hypothetical protein